MTTAQDQQSRADFEAHALEQGWAYRDPQYGLVFYDHLPKVIAWKAWQAARALPASMKPVAEIFAGDLFRVNQGPDAEPVTGDHDLYTAAQVLAMLAQGLAPGWQAVPVEPTIAMLIAGDMPRISTEQTTKNHAAYAAMLAAAPRPPAAQDRKPLTDEQVQDLIGFGDPTEQECYLVRLGWSAANAIT